jgi:acyl-homoserine-lactone acylase
MLVVVVLAALACAPGRERQRTPATYSAEIRRTAYGIPHTVAHDRSERTLRTRIGIRMLEERLAPRDGSAAGMTLEELQSLAFENRDLGGELLADELVRACRAQPHAALDDGTRVDLRPACEVLARWDRRADLESRGAHLFREFLAEVRAPWREPFDPARPVETPRGLATDNPDVLRALARALIRLRDAGVALDARLGDVQHVTRAGRRIPIHGGPGRLGIFNAINTKLGPGGYTEIESGSSFIMAVRFAEGGPTSRALITYSQSANPESPHHSDQTELFSRKGWVEMRWREQDVLADPQLRSYRVSGPR